jgi:Lhr-like helicase
MERSQKSELAKRINRAYVLLNKDKTQPEAVEYLMKKYGVSQIQAYRYVRQARELTEKMPIPESSVVFTVKLSSKLIKRVKELAWAQGQTISNVTRLALEEFLSKQDNGKKGATT